MFCALGGWTNRNCGLERACRPTSPFPDEPSGPARQYPMVLMVGVAGNGAVEKPRANRPTTLFGQCTFTLATQFDHARSDHRKIIGGTGSGHVSSILFWCRIAATIERCTGCGRSDKPAVKFRRAGEAECRLVKSGERNLDAFQTRAPRSYPSASFSLEASADRRIIQTGQGRDGARNDRDARRRTGRSAECLR
jgi:hypothetical protein